MKPILCTLAMLLMCNSTYAKRTILSGHFDREAAISMSLQYYSSPLDVIERKKTFHETTLDANKDFTIPFDIDHPVMINVMNGDKWLFYNIFICPGDSIHMVFSDSMISMEGRGEKEFAFMFEHAGKFLNDPVVNKEFNSSHRRLDPLPYAQYWKKRLHDQLGYMNEYFKDTVIAPDFKKAFEYEVQYDYGVRLLQYSWRRSKDHRFLFKNKAYTTYLDSININNPAALISSEYIHFLRELPYCVFTSNINHNDDADPDNEYYYKNQNKLRDSIARQYFTGKVYDMALYQILYESVKNMADYKGSEYFDTAYQLTLKEIETLGANFGNDSLKERLKMKLADFVNQEKPAPDFTAMDMKGNEVKLSDFRGKVVYAEFWSTTCVPCVQELPKTKELQEHYKDRDDLVFLYIAFDSPQSKAEEFIKKRDFTGTHLFSSKGFASDAAQKYNISAIPRYILVDKEGKLVTGDAPRPSHNPKELINSVLK